MASQQSLIDAYVDSVGQRLAQQGYKQYEGGPPEYETTVFHLRELSLSKFGFVDYFVVVATFDSPTPQQVTAFCEAAFSFGLSNKSLLPRGLGGSLVVYPIIVGEDLPEQIHEWVSEYRTKHWSSFEIPVVIDLGTDDCSYNRSKPTWGYIYYDEFNSFVDAYLAPEVDGQRVNQTVGK